MKSGKEVIPYLAGIYKQLYVAPGSDGAEEKYKAIVRRGEDVEKRALTHFATSDDDRLEMADTPAGKVCVITLFERKDFETFLQIMANRCTPKPIPISQGAAIIDGVINWEKINVHKKKFYEKEIENGHLFSDWSKEFKDFTSEKGNYLDALIVLSTSPYSGINASEAGLSDDKWLFYSMIIRKYHECTHFMCRRMFPEKIDAVWDEVVADAVGIYAAFGNYDTKMAMLFLGIDENGYKGGRLENYLKNDDKDPVSKKEELNELAKRVNEMILSFSKTILANKIENPFDIALILETNK